MGSMVSHTTYHCDNCGVEIDYLDMYDVHVSVRPPIRYWEEKRLEHLKDAWNGLGQMPSYIGDAQLCIKCYESKNIESVVGPNRMRVFNKMYDKH